MAERDLSGRCGTCSFFMALRTHPETGAQEGECRLGCWPPPLADTATCPHHTPRGGSWEGALRRTHAAGPPRSMREPAVEVPPRRPLPQEIDIDMDQDEFRRVMREVLLEELGVGEVQLADRWRGGEIVIRPGREGVQEKTLPIDALFKKVVMIRDKLRVLEQKVNASKKLSNDEKVQLQQYITGCYGSLTTFNALFRDREEGFIGQSGKD
ncbi:MAG: hypothetical protein ACFCGT_25520 [Sandaracinaceae bacterium]